MEARICRLSKVAPSCFMKLRYMIVTLLNIIGIVTYLRVAAKCWIGSSLAEVPGASGGVGIIWFETAVPTVVSCAVLNWLWVVFECLDLLPRSPRTLGITILVLPLAWALAIYLDFSHHGM